MNILVCVKQVPDTAEIRIDPETNTMIRDGAPAIVNTYDAYALEIAARIKDATPGCKIVALSMGPQQAQQALKECLATGADKAYLLSGREFAGSDTLATSYALSCALRKLEETEGKFDLVFCGKQAIDGDTAQVGPELAEHLGYPQITYAVEAALEGGAVRVKREADCGYEVMRAALPCVVTVSKPAFEPRYATVAGKLAANRAEIPMIEARELAIDLARVGLKGSPTRVKKTFAPSAGKRGVMIEEETGAQAAQKLCTLLCEAQIL